MRLRKLKLVLLSTGSVLLLAVMMHAGLTALARWGEMHHHSYPWRDEDYLRYVLPSLYEGRGPHRILLAGPSEAREGLIYQRFEQAFPGMEVYQGGQSQGTFSDLLVALEYMEKVYGPDGVPHALVVGITPRFVANLPPGETPLEITFNRYSPFYRVERTPGGPRLVAKSTWEGLVSRARFLPKQRGRYLAAMAALVNDLIDDPLPYERYEEEVFAKMRATRSGSMDSGILAMLKYTREAGPRASAAQLTKLYTSPYKYHHLPPWPVESIDKWLHHPSSFWAKVHAWDPTADSLLIRRQFGRLMELARRQNMQVYVVNLPEHPMNREGYQTGRYEQYLEQVQTSLPGIPFLNLREMVPAEDFYDVGHLNLGSALRVTDRVIDFMKARPPVPVGVHHTVQQRAGAPARPAARTEHREQNVDS